MQKLFECLTLNKIVESLNIFVLYKSLAFSLIDVYSYRGSECKSTWRVQLETGSKFFERFFEMKIWFGVSVIFGVHGQRNDREPCYARNVDIE